MKLSCEVIRDLLPLYHDGVCSNESKIIVEEHLAGCEGCKAELEAMNHALPDMHKELNLKEAEAVIKLSKRWKKGMFLSLLKGVLLTILTVAVMLLFLYIFVDFKIVV